MLVLSLVLSVIGLFFYANGAPPPGSILVPTPALATVAQVIWIVAGVIAGTGILMGVYALAGTLLHNPNRGFKPAAASGIEDEP
jgi:hypothetical protein